MPSLKADLLDAALIDVVNRSVRLPASVLTAMQISRLEVYPVKSCKGIPVQTAIILETGEHFVHEGLAKDDENVVLSGTMRPA